MPVFSDETFLSGNGKTNIHVRRCKPDGEICGVVQIAHGIAEHIERYDAFASFLAENGFLVVGNDHLGHGQSINSEEDLGFFDEEDGWDTVVGDMRKLHSQVSQEYKGLPYFLFGHSMGSFLVRSFIIKYPKSGIAGAVICGTAQPGSTVMKSGRTISRAEVARSNPHNRSQMLNNIVFGSYNNGFEKRTDYDWLTRDDAIVDAYVADPLCGFVPTAGLVSDMLNGMIYNSRRVNCDRMDPKLPVFFIAGDKDPVGDEGKGVQKIYTYFLNAGMEDVTLKLYHNCRHEILNELCKEQVMNDVLNWFKTKM